MRAVVGACVDRRNASKPVGQLDRFASLAAMCTIKVLHALADNFMYLIVDDASMEAAVVDPAEADVVVAAAAECGARITTVLTTHHHYDHAGGNNDMKRLVPGVAVIGGEPVQGMTRQVVDAEVLHIGGTAIRCLHTPAHTNGHMSYVVSGGAGEAGACFTGDALFVGGCGRFFEGGPEDMLAATAKLSALPAATRVYVGHEYTVKNLAFALDCEPTNPAAVRKMQWAQEAVARGEPTVPSTIGDELTYNPFLRVVSSPAVRAYAGGDDDVAVMRRLRNKKDSFVGTTRPWIPGGGPLPGL